MSYPVGMSSDETGNHRSEALPSLSESYRRWFEQRGLNLVHPMSYEAHDIKEADDQYCERRVEQDFHFVRPSVCVGAGELLFASL